jgi:hypothetical protein
VNDQFFFREELERAIALHIDRVPKIAVSGWKNGDDDALFMIVGRLFNPFAYRKFCHRELLSDSSGAIIPPKWLTDLKQLVGGSASSPTVCRPAPAGQSCVTAGEGWHRWEQREEAIRSFRAALDRFAGFVIGSRTARTAEQHASYEGVRLRPPFSGWSARAGRVILCLTSVNNPPVYFDIEVK